MTNLIEAQSGVNLIIDPSAELRFRGPFNQPITNNLKLTNPLDEMIWFKIKTSEAKRYCVRPNSGKVHPRETVVVKISLQPSPYIDAYKNWKHKFMIQCVVLSEVEKNFVDVMDIWKELPADRFMNTKLNCVFELPVENGDTTNVKLIKIETIALPQAEAEKKISNVELFDHSEILANEIRELREENLNVKKEVLNLKDQILQIKTSSIQKRIPMIYIAFAIAATIFSVILGTFLLGNFSS